MELSSNLKGMLLELSNRYFPKTFQKKKLGNVTRTYVLSWDLKIIFPATF